MTKIFLLLTILLFEVCCSYKLLVLFPVPGKSHAILGDGYVRHLLKAGHEVTYITPMVVPNPPPNLRQIDVSANFKYLPSEEVFNMQQMIDGTGGLLDPKVILQVMHVLSDATVKNENVQKLLNDPNEQFDAVIVEWMFTELYSGFGPIFKCPLIWSSSMEPHYMVLSLIDEGPNPAYISDTLSSELAPFNFLQRVSQLWSLISIQYSKWHVDKLVAESYNAAFSAAAIKRGVSLPPLDIAKYNASLMLGNSHVSSGQAIRLPQNYIPIAGYHIDPIVKPLPQDLQKIMDSAKNGVIYFSMGTMLNIKTLAPELKKGLVDTLSSLKQTVIWKSDVVLENLPKNVHIVQWAPQPSILAHPNCVLFITHGGLLSTTEALHFGVPIIGMPMYADQFSNVNRAQAKGFAKRVDHGANAAVNLKAAIEEMLGNPRYREKIAELSLVYHDRRISPGDELVHWVEHVVRTNGAVHLRSPALMVPWYQKMYLDLLAVIIATIIVIIKIFQRLFKTKSKKDVKKKRN